MISISGERGGAQDCDGDGAIAVIQHTIVDPLLAHSYSSARTPTRAH